MSVVIRGMEMPVCEHQGWDIRRGTDGKWYMVDTNAETTDGEWHEIVPVPPHGRLIDADALKETLDYYIREAGWSDEINEALTWVRDEFIDHEPTIIEAEVQDG